MHDTRCRADLCIGEARDVLLNEVDQSALPLQGSQELERGTEIAFHGWLDFSLGTWRSGLDGGGRCG